jgi:cell division protein FtsB
MRDENSKLQKQLKQATGGGSQAKSGNVDRELAKLSVENDLLRKQVEDLQSKLNS